jgi:hypothetical protein
VYQRILQSWREGDKEEGKMKETINRGWVKELCGLRPVSEFRAQW